MFPGCCFPVKMSVPWACFLFLQCHCFLCGSLFTSDHRAQRQCRDNVFCHCSLYQVLHFGLSKPCVNTTSLEFALISSQYLIYSHFVCLFSHRRDPWQTAPKLRHMQTNKRQISGCLSVFQTETWADDGQFWEQPIPGSQWLSTRTDFAPQGCFAELAHC